MNKTYIASVTGSRGCHSQEDIDRAIEAAEAVFAESDIDASDAFSSYMNRLDGLDCIDEAADLWQKAQQAADAAFTEGWANPGNVLVELAVGE